jgi:hypothetical protein
MKKTVIILIIVGLISVIFASTMVVHTINGEQEFELSDITSITFNNANGEIPTEGLIAYYPFNGNANDESGNGFDLTFPGNGSNPNACADRFNNENSSYRFDNSQDGWGTFLYKDNETDPLSGLSSGTVNFWVSVESFQDAVECFCVSGNNGELFDLYSYWTRYQIFLNEGGVAIGTYEGNAISYSVNTTINHWVMITISWNASGRSLYYNGQLCTSDDIPAIQNGGVACDWFIGRNPWSHSHQEGNRGIFALDDFRFYNRALSEEQIQLLYHENGWDR